ncbi:MAG: hypothetical protein WKF84_00430 [Pyrinomonadaceae bacterium]
MAEIPVERKSGLPWWLPLLALLGLLLFGFLLMRGCNDRAAVVNTNDNINRNANSITNTSNANARITTENTGTATGARVTDVNIFGSTTDKMSLVGRGVEVQNVKVNRVLSDHVFTVTSGSSELFVMLDESLDSGGGKERQIQARSGQLVNLGGTFQRVPNNETSGERGGGGLNAREYQQMANQQVYLHATEARDAR